MSLEAAAWTNFSQDHLDYHEDMDSHFQAKLRICDYLKKGKNLKVLAQETSLVKILEKEFRFLKVESFNSTSENKVLSLEHNQNNIASLFLYAWMYAKLMKLT